jgi:TatD DNase family protein
MNQDPEYIDVHAHLNFVDFDTDREELIRNTLNQNTWMINVGTNLETSKRVLELAKKYDEGVYAIVGLHPTEVATERFDIEEFEKLVADSKVVAIGECGIDVFRIEDTAEKERLLKMQAEDFKKQIDLAVKYDKPIMIHARESYDKILEILDDSLRVHGAKLRGNAHFFVGTIEEAKAFLDRGFTLSFTGVITFAKQYEELVKYAPLDMILSETDCPFVAPVPYRGRRNQPIYVKEVVSRIAALKGLDEETVKKALISNAKRQFSL